MKLKFDKEDSGGGSFSPGRVSGAPGIKYNFKGNIFAKGGSTEMKKVFAGKESKAEEAKEKVAAKKAGMSYKAAERKFEGEGYARGGGVESKGKTKGTMVKMARGGGVESRGKTRGKMV